MPFIGSSPAESALTTGDLGDNIVDGTKTKDALIADYSDVTVTASDLIMYGDATDSNNTKRDTVQGILDLVSAGFTLGTEQATTSGTSVTFGSIPAGVKAVVIMFEGVSFNANADMDVTIGDAGGLETSGYVSCGFNGTSGQTSTSEFLINIGGTSEAINGSMFLNLKDSSNYTWVSSHIIAESTQPTLYTGGGVKSLSGELTQLSVSGSTFDAGSINIMYM
jgi:hypothetical protein